MFWVYFLTFMLRKEQLLCKEHRLLKHTAQGIKTFPNYNTTIVSSSNAQSIFKIDSKLFN